MRTSVVWFLALLFTAIAVGLVAYGTKSIEFFSAVMSELVISGLKTATMLAIYFAVYKIRLYWDSDFEYSKIVKGRYEFSHYVIQLVIIAVIIIFGFW